MDDFYLSNVYTCPTKISNILVLSQTTKSLLKMPLKKQAENLKSCEMGKGMLFFRELKIKFADLTDNTVKSCMKGTPVSPYKVSQYCIWICHVIPKYSET